MDNNKNLCNTQTICSAVPFITSTITHYYFNKVTSGQISESSLYIKIIVTWYFTYLYYLKIIKYNIHFFNYEGN